MGDLSQNVRHLVRPLARPLRRKLRRGSRALKREIHPLTARVRMLPDFIIIGTQKGGTSSLYDYLAQHPCIAPALESEVHFFDANFHKGINWYRAHFPSLLYRDYVRKVQGRQLITGEKSPYYMFYPHAPRRIFETLPHVKLIVMLRNPVDRAYSHYYHQVRKGRETLSFEEAIAAEPERLKGELEKILEDERYTSYSHVHFSYLSRGIYVDQLKVWMRFFPREQFLILKSEDFFADPPAVYRQVLAFLGLPDWELRNYKKHNVGRYSEMDPATRRRLVEYFRPHNQRLYDYLGVDFGWDR